MSVSARLAELKPIYFETNANTSPFLKQAFDPSQWLPSYRFSLRRFTRYPLLLGGQRQCRMRLLPEVHTRDQLRNRTVDLSLSVPTQLLPCNEQTGGGWQGQNCHFNYTWIRRPISNSAHPFSFHQSHVCGCEHNVLVLPCQSARTANSGVDRKSND
jgi:hypothetical protein